MAVGDDLVVLDVSADEYRCAIGQAAEPPFRASNAGEPLPTDDLADNPARGRLTAKRVLDFALATLTVMRMFKRSSLEQLTAAGASNRQAPTMKLEAVRDEVAAFQKLRLWTPLDGDCLLRSFWLHTYLRRRGCQVSWVFGVRTYPFLAHCWLQFGPVALDDDCQRLLGYTPIMAVR